MRAGEKVLLEAARRNGIKVFAVDDLSVGFNPENGLPTISVAETMPRRNAAMAGAAAALLKKRTCSKLVGLAGGAHVVKGFYDAKDPSRWRSISDRLREAGLKVATVRIMSRASYQPAYGDPFAPKECSWNIWDGIEAPGGIFGFIPASPAPACFYPLYPHGDPKALREDTEHPVNWDNYQGVVVVP